MTLQQALPGRHLTAQQILLGTLGLRRLLPQLLEKAHGGAGGDVERLDVPPVRNRNLLCRQLKQLGRHALPFVPEQPRGRLAQIELVYRARGMRACGKNWYATACN